MAFPLIIHQDHECQTLTIIEEPSFPIIHGMSYYYAADELSVQFNFEGVYGILHDAVLLYWAKWVDHCSAG
jgi:hypothetical protein